MAALPIREQRLALLPQQRADARDELNNAERLGEVIVGAGFEAPHAAGDVALARYHDDWDLRRRRIGLDAPAGLEPSSLGIISLSEMMSGFSDLIFASASNPSKAVLTT